MGGQSVDDTGEEGRLTWFTVYGVSRSLQREEKGKKEVEGE